MAKNNAKPKSNLIDGWEVVIGIEIHTQLATKSKIFSGSSTEFGNDPNTQASLVDLAMPGVLPVLNKEVVDLAIRFGLGIDAYAGHPGLTHQPQFCLVDAVGSAGLHRKLFQ